MKHRSLMADGIRTVASNAQQVSCTQDVIRDVWKILMSEADRHYKRGRRIPPSTLQAVFKSLDEILMNNLQIVDCRVRETLATMARPKSASIDVSYVGVMKKRECDGYPDLYELFTLRVVIKSKVVTLHLHPHPITFQYHAAERVVGRVSGQTLPFEMIASELADWSLALWEIFRLTKGDIEKLPLSLPCMEGKGMLAGRFVNLPVSRVTRTTSNKTGRYSKTMGSDEEMLPVFVVKTFVGQDKLYPDQVSALNRLARWRLLNKAEYMIARDALLWDVGFYDDGYVVPELSAKPRADLLAILEDPAVKRAMTHRTFQSNPRAFRNASVEKVTAEHPVWMPPKPAMASVASRAM